MAGGLTYTALDSTSLSTAEIYGQALVVIIHHNLCREIKILQKQPVV